MSQRTRLPRQNCPECGRRVPITEPRGGQGETFRYHSAVVGGQTACPASRTPAGIPAIDRRDLSFWCGPRTWEDAELTPGLTG